jgi:hypothetical protein
MSDPAELKRRSEALLEQLGIAIHPNLPEIESLEGLTPRPAPVVARRALVLMKVAETGFGRLPAEVIAALETLGLDPFVTPAEWQHLRKSSYTEPERGWAQWLMEALHACSWCLGHSQELQVLSPTPDHLVGIFRDCPDIEAFIATASLRPLDHIRAYADFYYRVHWAARQARLGGCEGVIPETMPYMRRWALDWVMGVPREWDAIPHDT